MQSDGLIRAIAWFKGIIQGSGHPPSIELNHASTTSRPGEISRMGSGTYGVCPTKHALQSEKPPLKRAKLCPDEYPSAEPSPGAMTSSSLFNRRVGQAISSHPSQGAVSPLHSAAEQNAATPAARNQRPGETALPMMHSLHPYGQTPTSLPRGPAFNQGYQEARGQQMRQSSNPPPQFVPQQCSAKKRQLQEKMDAVEGGATELGDGSKAPKQRWRWLSSDRRDANARLPSDPEYDATTLLVPPSELESMTAFQRQYWAIKSQCMDIVLFVRHGSFYNLFDLDADVGLRAGLNLSGGLCPNMWKVGCNHTAFPTWAAKVMALGYADDSTSVCDVDYRPVVSILEGNDGWVGMCAADLSVGVIYLSQFQDNRSCSSLATALFKSNPSEIVVMRGRLSLGATSVAKRFIMSTVLMPLPMSCIPSMLASAHSALSMDADDLVHQMACVVEQLNTSSAIACSVDPTVNLQALSQNLSQAVQGLLSKHGSADIALALQAMLLLLSHLSRCQDSCVSSQPPRELQQQLTDHAPTSIPRHMLLDDRALLTLDLLEGSMGGRAGSLLAFIDQCCTASGKRKLRQWICRPLAMASEIEERLQVVDAFMLSSDNLDGFRQALCGVPDLERLMPKATCALAAVALSNKQWGHVYQLLGGLAEGVEAVASLRQECRASGKSTPALVVRAATGASVEYDKANAAIQQLERDMMNAIKNEKQALQGMGASSALLSKIKLVNATDGLLSAPAGLLSIVRKAYQVQEAKSGAKATFSFVSPSVGEIAAHLTAWQEQRAVASASVLSHVAQLFSSGRPHFSNFINQMSALDVLSGFALATHPSVAPEAVPNSMCLGGPAPEKHLQQDGGDDTRQAKPTTASGILLLTGANMGGKSTLLRATCLAVIMAQIGCYVPCAAMELSPVDCVFTRMGAHDRIVSGESTFQVEMVETASCLLNASPASLLVLDELGRGTSTFDGYALAYAVLSYVASTIGCRTLFATHYHGLCAEPALASSAQLAHMSTSVSQDGSLVPLHRLKGGAAPMGSCGIQVAGLAGLSSSILCRAASKAHELAEATESKMHQSGGGSRGRMDTSGGSASRMTAGQPGVGGIDGVVASAGVSHVPQFGYGISGGLGQGEGRAVQEVVSLLCYVRERRYGQGQGQLSGGSRGGIDGDGELLRHMYKLQMMLKK
eukprot:gene14772-20821_t